MSSEYRYFGTGCAKVRKSRSCRHENIVSTQKIWCRHENFVSTWKFWWWHEKYFSSTQTPPHFMYFWNSNSFEKCVKIRHDSRQPQFVVKFEFWTFSNSSTTFWIWFFVFLKFSSAESVFVLTNLSGHNFQFLNLRITLRRWKFVKIKTLSADDNFKKTKI